MTFGQGVLTGYLDKKILLGQAKIHLDKQKFYLDKEKIHLDKQKFTWTKNFFWGRKIFFFYFVVLIEPKKFSETAPGYRKYPVPMKIKTYEKFDLINFS